MKVLNLNNHYVFMKAVPYYDTKSNSVNVLNSMITLNKNTTDIPPGLEEFNYLYIASSKLWNHLIKTSIPIRTKEYVNFNADPNDNPKYFLFNSETLDLIEVSFLKIILNEGTITITPVPNYMDLSSKQPL